MNQVFEIPQSGIPGEVPAGVPGGLPAETPSETPEAAQQENPREKPKFWATARRGWLVSVIVALVLLILPFKDIIWSLIKAPQMLEELSSASPFWQSIVKNGLTDNIGTVLETMLPFVMFIGGCVLFAYALVSGYYTTYRALEINDRYDGGEHRKPGRITMGNIALRSLLVNVPILYWAGFLFLGLPQLVKLPIASLSTGSIAALVAACVGMVIVAVLATHVGMTLTRLLLRYMARAQ